MSTRDKRIAAAAALLVSAVCVVAGVQYHERAQYEQQVDRLTDAYIEALTH